MAISITRLSGGNTPADGSDPRTFPAIWNATAATLEANVGVGGASVTTSDTAPVSPAEGDLWWKSDEGKLYVYYNDGTSTQWVDAAGPTVAVQSTAPTGFEGQLWLDDTDGSMYVYYTDPGGGSSSWIGAVSRSGGILQVVQTTKTDTYSVSLGNGAFSSDVTGLTASITPRSTSSKIMVMVTVNGSNSGNGSALPFRLTRNTSPIFVGDTAGSRLSLSSFQYVDSANTSVGSNVSATFLDSPSTTSSTTYGIQLANPHTSTFTYYVNRTNADTDNVFFPRTASSITLIEVAG